MSLQRYLPALFDVHGIDEGAYSFVVSGRKVYCSDVNVVYINTVVILTTDDVLHRGRNRYLCQTHLPMPFEFDLIGKFRRVPSHSVVRIVLHRTVGSDSSRRQRLRHDFVYPRVELGGITLPRHEILYLTTAFPSLQYAIDIEVLDAEL